MTPRFRAKERLRRNALVLGLYHKVLAYAVKNSTVRKIRFSRIAQSNEWGDPKSLSGVGSSVDATEQVRSILPELVESLGVRSILDAPSGDAHWISSVDLRGVRYIGVDIVPAVVAAAQRNAPHLEFHVADLESDDLPAADLVMCRDLLVHLPHRHAHKVLTNFRRTGAEYFLTTTFVDRTSNPDILMGNWRAINLELAPYDFPQPLMVFNEGCAQGEGTFADKSLALWRFADLPT